MRALPVSIGAALLAACAGEPVHTFEPGMHMAALPLANCRPGSTDQMPVFRMGIAPHLPSFDAGLRGPRQVWVAFTITEEGLTRDIEVRTEAGPAYAASTAAAAGDWRFEPAKAGGRSVAARCETSFSFDGWNRPALLSDPGAWRR